MAKLCWKLKWLLFFWTWCIFSRISITVAVLHVRQEHLPQTCLLTWADLKAGKIFQRFKIRTLFAKFFTCHLILFHRYWSFLQRVSIACYAKRCISYCNSVWPSVWPSVTRWYQAKTTQATITGTLVSSCLTSAQNSKGNLGSEGAEW